MNQVQMPHRPASDADQSQPISTDIDVSLLDILALLFRNRRILLWATIASTAIALVVALLWPPTYTATTSLLPPQQNNNSFSSMLVSQLGSLGSLGGSTANALKSPTDLYVGLLKSETVEYGVVNRFKLQQEYRDKRLSDARKDLEDHVKIDGTQKDGLIRIAASARSPERAAELANGYVDEYRRLSASLAIGEASQRRLFLEQQMLQTKNNLATAEENLKRTEQTTGMLQLDTQARALIESAGSLRAQVAAKEVEVQSMRTYAGEENSDLREAEQELSGLRAQLAKLGGSGGPDDNELMLPKGKLPEAGLEYVRKLREVKYNETLFEIIARQYEAAKLDEAKEGAMVQVVDVARIPDRKSAPLRFLIVLIGAFIGFSLALAWIVFKKARTHLKAMPEYRRIFEEPAQGDVEVVSLASAAERS
jgi:tyrosine-protein kinase Etk/Wzc